MTINRSIMMLAASALVAVAACSNDANLGTSTRTGSDPTSAPTSPNSDVRPTDTRSTEPRSTEPRSTEPDSGPGTTELGTNRPGTTGLGGPVGLRSNQLSFFGDCEALLNHLQTEAGERVGPWGLGGGYDYYGRAGGAMTETTEAMSDDTASAEAGGAPTAVPQTSGPSYSETNTQEVGVDEGDIVETNGEVVYVASSDAVRIVSVADARVVGTLDLPDGTHQLLLDGDRLLVVTASWSGGADTIVSLYDVVDPTSPELIRRSHLEGAVIATRSIDGVARLVLSTGLDQRLDFVSPDRFGFDEELATERNKQIIEESSIEDWLPRWFDESNNGGFDTMAPILDCNRVAAPAEYAGLGITWIASIDMDGDATPIGSAGVVSSSQNVYASTDNLYVTTQNWDDWYGAPIPVDSQTASSVPAPDGPPPTLIHQFRLGPDTDASYIASGQVDGRLLNSYSMSEHDGDLRVATTVDAWNDQTSSESIVTVLRPDGDELAEISRIEGLGDGEQIYAVRFIGDVGYVVTFRQVDPLYVLDLSDPTNPVLDGELKIPGYSAYLHPVGDGLLLGVGQNATDDGRTTGTQLSLFDVSDPSNPQQLDTLPIGGYSEVEYDPRAFLYWQPDGTVVIPASPGWNECGPQVDCLADQLVGGTGGVVVAEVDGRTLAARGVISHESQRQSGCWNPLQRSIVIGDELVTIGLDQLTISDRETLAERDSVSWGNPEDYGCYWYTE